MAGLRSGRSLLDLSIAHGAEAAAEASRMPVVAAPGPIAADPAPSIPVRRPRAASPPTDRRPVPTNAPPMASDRDQALRVLTLLASGSDAGEIASMDGLSREAVHAAIHFAIAAIEGLPADREDRRLRALEVLKAARDEPSKLILSKAYRVPVKLARHLDNVQAHKLYLAQVAGSGRKPLKQDEMSDVLVEYYANNPLPGELDDLARD